MAKKSEAENHRCSMAMMLNSLRREEKLCDVTIVVGHKKFLAHKNVLSASSDFFHSMFTSGFQECEKDEICLELDGKSKNFEALLEFAYTGEMNVDLSVDDALDMLNMAAYLQLKHAVKVVSQILLQAVESTDVDLEEVFHIWTLAEPLGKGMCIEGLTIVALSFLAKNFVEFSQVDTFNSDVTSEFLEKCLARNNLGTCMPQGEEEEGKNDKDLFGVRTRREGKILDILISWLQYDWRHRKTHAYNLLRKVRLGLVSPDKVKNLLSAHLVDVPQCVQLLEAVIESLASKDAAAKLNQLSELFVPRGIITAPVLLDNNDSTIKFFEGAAGKWKDVKQFEDVPFNGLLKYSSLAIDGHLYIGGGMEGTDARKSFCRYDICERFSQLRLSDMESSRSDFVMVHMDHFIYAIGGVQSKIERRELVTRSVERYDINQVRYDSVIFEGGNSPWESVAPLPLECYSPHAVVYKGKLLVCGIGSQLPRIPNLPLNRLYHIPSPDIGYLLFMYDPPTDRWQQHHMEDRTMITCMQGNQNYVMLLVHEGECYLIGNVEVDSILRPGVKWFKITVNKLDFQEQDNGSLRFQQVGESVNQDLLGYEHYSAFFYIGEEVFYKWRRCVCKVGVKTTDENFKEILALWNDFPNGYSHSFASLTFDKDVVG